MRAYSTTLRVCKVAGLGVISTFLSLPLANALTVDPLAPQYEFAQAGLQAVGETAPPTAAGQPMLLSVGYQNQNYTGRYLTIPQGICIADDVRPIQLCSVATIQLGLTRSGGGTSDVTVSAHMNFDGPNGPQPGMEIPGSQHQFGDIPNDGSLFLAEFDLLPGSLQTSERFWVVVCADSPAGWAISGLSNLGLTEDYYSVSTDGGSSWLVQAGATTGNDWGGTWAIVGCLEPELIGACCIAPDEACIESIGYSECRTRHGRWTPGTCADLDPPCNEAACCFANDPCFDGAQGSCVAQGGIWSPEHRCDTSGCPPFACLESTNECGEENIGFPGCSDVACCEKVCAVDDFCCTMGWDVSCATLARIECSSVCCFPSGECEINVPDGFCFAYSGESSGESCAHTVCPSPLGACCLPGGACQLVLQVDCDAIPGGSWKGGLSQCFDLDHNGVAEVCESSAAGCPVGSFTFTDPLNGVVDARQPHPINDASMPQGIQEIAAVGPPGAENPSCWSLCETGTNGPPNFIQSVVADAGGTNYIITLARPITPGAVTTISYSYFGGDSTGTFTFHPGNVNANSFTAPQDILAVIDCLNGINQETNCPWGMLSCDIDRSNVCGPPDILRVIDLLNGANAYEPWIGTPLPQASGLCPALNCD